MSRRLSGPALHYGGGVLTDCVVYVQGVVGHARSLQAGGEESSSAFLLSVLHGLPRKSQGIVRLSLFTKSDPVTVSACCSH